MNFPGLNQKPRNKIITPGLSPRNKSHKTRAFVPYTLTLFVTAFVIEVFHPHLLQQAFAAGVVDAGVVVVVVVGSAGVVVVVDSAAAVVGNVAVVVGVAGVFHMVDEQG